MKVFISHSSKDKEIGKLIVKLLKEIGVNSSGIVFTSLEGYGIPKGENIFDWLKSQLKEKPYIIYLLSDSYYSSVACLNEMGAAWMIESKHIFFFAPNFDLNNDKFLNGAIDPRKMGIHAGNKEDLISFCDEFIKQFNLETKLTIISRAVEEFISAVNKQPKLAQPFDNDSQSVKPTENSITDKGVKSNNLFDEIKNDKLIDEEILAIAYLNQMGKAHFLCGWQEHIEVEQIREWENINELNSKLSDGYSKVLNRFKIRRFIEPSDFTTNNNVKEYSLFEEIKSDILNLPLKIEEIINEVLEKNRINDDLLF